MRYISALKEVRAVPGRTNRALFVASVVEEVSVVEAGRLISQVRLVRAGVRDSDTVMVVRCR